MSAHDHAREHRECSEALGAYVLHALPPDQAQRMQRHLAECRPCREEAEAFQLAVDTLPLAAPPTRAPAELKQRIMAVVDAEAELLAAAGSGADAGHRSRGGWRRRLLARPVLAGAAAAGLAGAAVLGFVVRGGSDEQSARTVSAQLSAVGAPSTARAAVRVSDGHAQLLVRNLPDPPAGRVYVVWVSRRGQPPAPAGASFTLRTGEVDLPHSMRGVDAVMVTAEPRGGGRTPTSAPIAVAQMT